MKKRASEPKQNHNGKRKTDELRKIPCELKGRKFRFDYGHVTFRHNLGNNITLYNGNNKFKIICSQCGY